MWFIVKNLKIKAKLFIGFAIMLLMVIILGISAFINTSKLNAVSNTYSTSSLPNTKKVWQMQASAAMIQKHVLIAVSSNDINLVKDSINNAEKERDNLNELIKSYRETMKIDSELIDKFEEKMIESRNYRKQILELALLCDDEANKQAFDIYINNYLASFEEGFSILLQISNKQDELVAVQDNLANNANTSARLSIIIALSLAIILTLIISTGISTAISKPINEAKNAAKEIAKGNFNVNLSVNSKDETGELMQSFIKVRDTINLIVNRINKVSDELREGDTEARIRYDGLNGGFEEAAKAVNEIIDDYVDEILLILNAYGQFGKGNFEVELKQFPGKKAIGNEMFDQLKKNLKSVNSDVSSLITAAIEGRLETRINSSAYNGDWFKLTQGLNNLLEAIITPIDEANGILLKLSQGDFNISVNKNYKGSFFLMMNSFDKMIISVGSYIKEITEILETMASGDLRSSISREYIGQFNLIKRSINNISDTLRNTISEIKVSADNVLMGARQISESSMDLANGATMQASSIQELSASILTINEQTHNTANKAQNANDVSEKSIESAKEGNAEMLKMLNSMDEIKQASNSISKIIKVIDDIAFQTNLLALNAAVEAARAGQHGKGFAVVAEEVRSLAKRSSEAAKDTSVLIENTINKISEGTTIAQLTANSLQKIVMDINSVSEIISNIYLATKEQNDGISQVTTGINQISEVVQKNSASSEESAAAAEQLSSQSEVLNQMVAHFQI